MKKNNIDKKYESQINQLKIRLKQLQKPEKHIAKHSIGELQIKDDKEKKKERDVCINDLFKNPGYEEFKENLKNGIKKLR